jgi:hypothetical protein
MMRIVTADPPGGELRLSATQCGYLALLSCSDAINVAHPAIEHQAGGAKDPAKETRRILNRT